MNNAGLPGLGLGGLFYFFSVIWMLATELVRSLRGRSTRWDTVLFLVGITAAIVVALSATYWALDTMLAFAGIGGAQGAAGKVLRHAKPIIWTSGILAGFLLLVRFIGAIMPKSAAQS
jgi:hypothetical protein